MNARLLLLSLVRVLAVPAPAPARACPVPRVTRRSARAAVGCGVAAFAAATAALAAALDTARPEWRDPEYALRLNHLRAWEEKAPDRPLVLAVGSSCTQMGLSPAAMGFPDRPGSPLVYNLGYRGAHPFRAWLQLMRVLDAGVKPAAVLVQLSAFEIGAPGTAEEQLAVWAPRLSVADLRRVNPYTQNPLPLWRRWAAARLAGWATYREAIADDVFPAWQPGAAKAEFVWHATDEYGFAPHRGVPPGDLRRQAYAAVRRAHARGLAGRPVGEMTVRAIRDLVERCRSDGIAVAFFWAPESPTYRGWYSPEARAVVADFEAMLRTELGAAVFPAPDHLRDDDFADGYHLLPPGAARYSRWLADEHLKPWLTGGK